jgi:hypothetical protein
VNAAHLARGSTDHDHDRDSPYLSTRLQSGASDGAAMVVSHPLPRFARRAALPGMQHFVMLV